MVVVSDGVRGAGRGLGWVRARWAGVLALALVVVEVLGGRSVGQVDVQPPTATTVPALPPGRLTLPMPGPLPEVVAPAAGVMTVAEAQRLYRTGAYEGAIEMCGKAVAGGELGVEWFEVKARSEMAVGKYAEALKSCVDGVERYGTSIELRLVAAEALAWNDKPEQGKRVLEGIREIGEAMPWRFNDVGSKITLGRAMLKLGVDAREVLEKYYDVARKGNPALPEAYVASGELALLKQDHVLAAEQFNEAVKRGADTADVYFGLALAYATDEKAAGAALAKALEINPRHAGSLLLQAENMIDGEAYGAAEGVLKKVLEVNPKEARAWGFRAVIAHLTGKGKEEGEYRAKALESWKTNPEVDYLIGRKLSQNYRFKEGAAYQERALAFVPTYGEARVQLCQDLMRLGREEEGWKMAREASAADPYNVLAYNLVTLEGTLGKYATLENEHFIVRMEKGEAEVYGERVVRLLERARGKLTARYGVTLEQKTIVELFAAQKDFAIRTFGLPGGGDFLGVCFGPVVTINSPAGRGASSANWEATLWHEFCHTVTLTKTKNKMPRWLSEGISVYEEGEENASWGMGMLPTYREMILQGSAVPVSKLSSAFMAPPTPTHLMFAYYESAMVVKYLHEKYGDEAVRGVLQGLADGVQINEALAKATGGIEALDKQFEVWLKAKAAGLAPGVDWEKPKVTEEGSAAWAAWNTAHPGSYSGLLMEGRSLLEERKWAEAKVVLEKAVALYGAYAEEDSAYPMLAAAYRELKDAAGEKKVLEKFVTLNAAAIDERMRLAEMAAGEKAWAEVKTQADQSLAIRPMLPAAHRYLATAAEAVGDRGVAIEEFRALLKLDGFDRAEGHYRLAKLLFEEKQLPAARREVLMSLEEAPRYRDAHRLFVDIAAQMDASKEQIQ